MKGLFLFLIPFLLTCTLAHGQKKHAQDSVEVIIRLRNKTRKPIKDSVMVVFDRSDRRGAGVIRKVFVPVNNKVVLMKVPPAKYIIEVTSFSPSKDKYQVTAYVNKRHVNEFVYDVKLSGTFEPGLVIIPAEQIDLSNLRVLRTNLQ